MLSLNNHLQFGGGCCPPPPTPTVETPTNALSNTYVAEPTAHANTNLAPPTTLNTLPVPVAAIPNSYKVAYPPWKSPPKSDSQVSSTHGSHSVTPRESQSSPLHGSQASPVRVSQTSHYQSCQSSVREGFISNRSYSYAEGSQATPKEPKRKRFSERIPSSRLVHSTQQTTSTTNTHEQPRTTSLISSFTAR